MRLLVTLFPLSFPPLVPTSPSTRSLLQAHGSFGGPSSTSPPPHIHTPPIGAESWRVRSCLDWCHKADVHAALSLGTPLLRRDDSLLGWNCDPFLLGSHLCISEGDGPTGLAAGGASQRASTGSFCALVTGTTAITLKAYVL